MKIILTFEDLQKIIKDSYNGVNDVTIKNDDIEIILNVDGDKFERKKETFKQTTPNIIIPKTTEIKPGDKADIETRLALKQAEMEKNIAQETHIPLVKTIEEQNEEARQKGLMTKGRNSERVMKKLG